MERRMPDVTVRVEGSDGMKAQGNPDAAGDCRCLS
jgi:hypothetical protein